MQSSENTENNRIQIMVVEDDLLLAREIKQFLEKWNYHVILIDDFQAVAQIYRQRSPQLILMDINLPFYDGFYWCRKIREISEVPVLYISSRSDDKDKLQAYALGGDDYIDKPFSLDVLRAKVEALLRRTYRYHVLNKVWLTETVMFDIGSKELYVKEQPVELTPSERRILAKLIEYHGETVTREEMMLTLWNTDEFVSDGALTVLINRLRNKLSDCCGKEFIKTKKGQGYYLPWEESYQTI